MTQLSIDLFGINNCDTVKKARAWLTEQGIDYTFHDFKKTGVNQQQLQHWAEQLGWETLVNKKGLTWRRLPEKDKADLDQAKAFRLMQANTSLIKRPVLQYSDQVLVGFDALSWQNMLAQ